MSGACFTVASCSTLMIHDGYPRVDLLYIELKFLYEWTKKRLQTQNSHRLSEVTVALGGQNVRLFKIYSSSSNPVYSETRLRVWKSGVNIRKNTYFMVWACIDLLPCIIHVRLLYKCVGSNRKCSRKTTIAGQKMYAPQIEVAQSCNTHRYVCHSVYVCMYVCMHACLHVCMYVCLCVHGCRALIHFNASLVVKD